MALSLHRYSWPHCNPTIVDILKQRIQKERERSSSLITITIEDGLPECLIVEILSWLPVKSLLQFKSVCKLWYSIITSPLFISKHVQNYYNNSQELCLLAQYHVSQGEVQLAELLVDETPLVLAYAELCDRPLYPSFICGPCDGLYHLYRYDYQDRALWNPALNELRLLPPLIKKANLPPDTVECLVDDFGFGIDPVTKDYKVVVLQSYFIKTDDGYSSTRSDHPSTVFVYSLRTDSWKYCGDLSQMYGFQYNKCHVFVHGCCYWLGNYENPDVLILFDMATDAFQEIKVPHYDDQTRKRLGLYDDSLAFFTFHTVEQDLDVWTFNDGNWNKIFSVGPLWEIVDIVGYWKDNKLFCQGGGCKLVVYDADTDEMIDLGFQADHGYAEVYVYKESLVSIKP